MKLKQEARTRQTMSKFRSLAWLTVQLSLLTNAEEETTTTAAAANEQKEKPSTCGLYMAKSTYTASFDTTQPLGLYAGIEVEEGQPVGNPDLGIPTIDLFAHSPDADGSLFWSAQELSSYEDDTGRSSLAMIPGLGYAGSYNPTGHWNVNFDYEAPLRRYRGAATSTDKSAGVLDWRKDAGAGASTEYFNVVSKATGSIPAGAEIFTYIQANAEQEHAIKPESRTKASQIIQQFAELTAKHPDYFTPTEQDNLWNLIITDVVSNAQVKSLLPSSPEEALKIAAEADAGHVDADDWDENSLSSPLPRKSVRWLDQYGQCADNIQVGPSTIPQAGRGAFATRPIPKGSIVAPAPMARLSRSDLALHAFDEDGNSMEQVGKQLLLNYCYGHPDSSMLLIPYAPIVAAINHASDRTDTPQTPNVKLTWSESTFHDPKLRTLPLETLQDEDLNGPYGVMLDYVATRDIAPGDEIFLDYGTVWEDAWKQHESTWEEPDGPDAAKPTASILNALDEPFKTLEEQRKDPYPGFVRVLCTSKRGKDAVADEEEFDMDLTQVDLSDARGPVQEFTSWPEAHEIYCKPVARQTKPNGEVVYLVKTLKRGRSRGDDNEEDEDDSSSVGATYAYVKNVPHDSIMFVDAPYSSSMHLQSVFRHEIGFPEGLFPEQWKDLRESEGGLEKKGRGMFAEE